MPDVELRVPPDVQYVGLARLVVTAAARQAGMTNDRIEDLKIAVSEAAANAIQAHQRAGETSAITLTFGPTGADQFGVTIADAGPEGAAPDSIGGRNWNADGGLGVTLIRGLADVVDFRRDAGVSVHMRFAVGLTPPGSRSRT
ncbi:MAG TPA: ATP-binding protein [Solirubrobacteraceae bacterium]|nr:ATP-binding protein [Solirubrobacteraceae bacterium]